MELAEAAEEVVEDQSRVEIRKLSDAGVIAGTIGHPRIYPHSSDDFSPPPGRIGEFVVDGAFLCLGAFMGGRYLGMFAAHQHNGILFEVHTCLLPEGRGPTAKLAAAACIEWLFRNTACRRLITSVPADNPAALKLALSVGMSEYGINPRSIQRGGKLLDVRMLGVSKE